MVDIKFQPKWYDNALLCPVCNGNNLHQESVVMYDRIMDPRTVLVTRAYAGNIQVKPMPAAEAGNPSADRNAIAIEFWCENCHGEWHETPPHYLDYFRLQIQQHKGTTFLDWDIPSK